MVNPHKETIAKFRAEYPVGGQPEELLEFPRHSNTEWPRLSDDAYHGITGEVVSEIASRSEAHPVAILLDFLTSAGNAIGHGPHGVAERDRHGVNLFSITVGATSKGRKGSARGQIRELFRRVDPVWADLEASGLNSGEGLAYHVRDDTVKAVEIKDDGKPTGRYEDQVIEVGIHDKRLPIIESEFAKTLKVMSRDTNTLSALVRQAWDTGSLRTLTKNNPVRATGAHISIIGHITVEELRRYINQTELANGFANRFLWVLVHRSKSLPHGGGEPDYRNLVPKLQEVLTRARGLGRIDRSEDANRLWEGVYDRLSEGQPGLSGAATSRAEAQVLRLSVLYAVMDGSHLVEPLHLRAALAVWEYAEASARIIFGQSTGNKAADRILEHLGVHGSLDRTQLHGLFSRNISAAKLAAAIRTLEESGFARVEKDTDTGGRPKDILVLVEATN